MIGATRFGKPLPDGGTIGVAAAASPYDSRSDVLRGIEWWEDRGYRVKLASGAWERDDYVAGDARTRGDDLNALFADPEVDVVQALQGGFGSAQAIPYLDFDLIAANPKPLVGFSDLTALHVALRQKAGVGDDLWQRPAGSRKRRDVEVLERSAARGAARRRRRKRPARSGRPVGADDPRRTSDRTAWWAVVSGFSCRRWEHRGRSSSTARFCSSRTCTVRRPFGHGKHLAALPLGVSCTLDADARTLTVDEAALR